MRFVFFLFLLFYNFSQYIIFPLALELVFFYALPPTVPLHLIFYIQFIFFFFAFQLHPFCPPFRLPKLSYYNIGKLRVCIHLLHSNVNVYMYMYKSV